MLTRDQILAADDLPRELVEVPEWGGSVYVRTLTGTEADAQMAEVLDGRRDLQDYHAKMAAACICDDAGKRLFSDADVKVLGAKSVRALDRVVAAVNRINGLGKEDEEAVVKNSETATPDGGSTSGSQDDSAAQSEKCLPE